MRRSYWVAGAAVALVVGALWWWRSGAAPGDASADGVGESRTRVAARTVGAEPAVLPGWFAAPEAERRRVAGLVVAGGAPVAGARVRLRHALIAAGAMPAIEVETGTDGRFDFGPQPPARMSLGVAADGLTPRGLELDLNDPTLVPPPDELRIQLYPCAAWVRGQVTDASGGAVVAATVRVDDGDAVVITGEDGSYRVCVPHREIELTVGAAGYATVRERVLVAGEVTRDFELMPGAALAGRVERIDDGSAVAGALVTARLQTFGWASESSTAVTGADGAFAFDDLIPGRYQLRVHDAATVQTGDVSTVARVGEIRDQVVIQMAPGYQVRGTATIAGAPAPGVSLMTRSAHAVTGEDGRFTLEPVASGPQILFARGHELIEPAGSLQVDGDLEVTVRLKPQGVVRGRVLQGGEPVEGAEVAARGRGYGARDLSDAEGRYRLTGLQPGSYSITATSLRVGAFSTAAEVEIDGAEELEADLVLDLAGSITGRVVDAEDRPVAGVFVSASLRGGEDYGQAFTADDGSFVLRALSGGGLYDLKVAPAPQFDRGFAAAGGGPLEPVAVAGGSSEVTGVVLRIDAATATIGGRVETSSGAPVPDAVVKAVLQGAWRGGGQWRDVTGADGRFVLRGLLPGEYPVLVQAPSGEQRFVEDPVPTGTGDLVVVFEQEGAVSGRLVGYTDEVEVRLSPKRSMGRISARVTGDRFHVDQLPPGAYAIEVSSPTQAGAAEVTVEPGATAEVTVTNPGSQPVRGTVVELDSGQPIEGALCGWGRSSGIDLSSVDARSDAAGHFEVTVPVGHRVTCWKIRYHMSSVLPGSEGQPVTIMALPIRGHDSNAGFRLDDDSGRLLVTAIAGGGPAEAAGLREGDVLVTIDGRDVTMLDGYSARNLIERQPPGTVVRLGLERDGEPVAAALTLAASG